MSAKKIHRSSIIGQQGADLIERIVLGMGFLWHPTGGVEAGIDGIIEIRDPTTGEVASSVVHVAINRASRCGEAGVGRDLANFPDGYQITRPRAA